MNAELLKRLKSVPFPFEKETWVRPSKPTQICLHHTASGAGIQGDVNWWVGDKTQVSTPIIIGRDGIANQLYPTERWAFALGLNHSLYRTIEALTISIEIDTWGFLTKKTDGYYSWAGSLIPDNEVCILDKPWRGQQYFHKYTPEQIGTTKLLLEHLGGKYGINLRYKGDEVFNLTNNAIFARESGVYSHASFRPDKTDIHPQADMIAMLKAL